MQTSGNTILITGGSRGIGFEMAKVFTREGNTILTCGRNQDSLDRAQGELPDLKTFRCDVSDGGDRATLLAWALETAPDLNVVINNAAIMHPLDFSNGTADSATIDDEIAINIAAPIHLNALFLPHLRKQPAAAIVNITSLLAYVPLALAPIYCASKAAIHSYTQSLREQLKATSVDVFEIFPPAVDTDMTKELDTPKMSPVAVAEGVFSGMRSGKKEIRLGVSKIGYAIHRIAPGVIFKVLNKMG